MDRKSVIILALCGALFIGWFQLMTTKYAPKPGARRLGTNAVPAVVTNAPADPVVAATAAQAPGAFLPKPSAPEEQIILTNELARYTFTSHGGALKEVALLNYPESVSCNRAQAAGPQRLATINSLAHDPILGLAGGESLTGDGLFKLTRISRPGGAAGGGPVQGVRAEKILPNGLRLVKEFEPASNYLVNAHIEFQNSSAQPITLPGEQWVAGTSTPMNPQDAQALVGLHWHDGKSDNEVGRAWFDNKTLGCLPGTPRTAYQSEGHPVAWATAYNQFFFTALMPQSPAGRLTALRYPLPPPSNAEIAADPATLTNQFAIQVNLQYPSTNVAAGETLKRDFLIFAGPKHYRTLQKLGAVLKNDLDTVMGYGGFWGFFSSALLLSMNWLNSLGLGYGLAIITITIVIKLIFWPLTAISTRASKRMQALQPQVKALQERYKEDPMKLNKKMMELWKENKVSPMSGCWPMMLQLPVLIGFFKMVQSAIELRGASFLWACDLSQADTIWTVPGVNFNINPLWILMGATMLWQARLMPPAPGMDPAQQRIMKYFPMFFLVILYNYSAGLTLYWTMQNLLSIAQTKLTRAADGRSSSGPTAPAAAAGVRPAPGTTRKKK